jgi:hypothetical protein
MSILLASFFGPLEHELKPMDFPSSFGTLKMMPLHVQGPAEIYIIFGAVSHARKELSLTQTAKFALLCTCFGVENSCQK